MFFAPSYTRHERSLIARLQLLGLEGERVVVPRQQFRSELRTRLLAERPSQDRCSVERALAPC